MKTRIFLLAGLIASGIAISGKNEQYQVDAKQSKITWVGRKVTGEHSGNISLANGTLIYDGKTFKGGNFVMNMESITNTDIESDEYKQKLIGHLKSDDFFSTSKFPKATLAIKSMKPAGENKYDVKGDLTIKGITKEVEFPATIRTEAGVLKAQAKIVVDRTKYDIRYGSGSFFDNLGDKAIDDKFELNVDLVGKK